jgi:hypothetical protein
MIEKTMEVKVTFLHNEICEQNICAEEIIFFSNISIKYLLRWP